jgi:hypothetical protein
MSQQETIVGIARIPAEGLSKHAAVAKMSIDFPEATVRGIQPEPVDGYWVGILQKNAVSKFEDDNTDSAPVGAGSSGFDHDIDSLGLEADNVDMPEPGAEHEEHEDIHGLLQQILDRLDAIEGGEAGGDDFGFDPEMTEGRFESREWGGDDEGGLDDSTADMDRQQMKMKSSTIKVNRDRAPGMTVRQARVELTKEASVHPKLKNYQIVEIDVSSDGSRFEATLAPKQRRRRSR